MTCIIIIIMKFLPNINLKIFYAKITKKSQRQFVSIRFDMYIQSNVHFPQVR